MAQSCGGRLCHTGFKGSRDAAAEQIPHTLCLGKLRQRRFGMAFRVGMGFRWNKSIPVYAGADWALTILTNGIWQRSITARRGL